MVFDRLQNLQCELEDALKIRAGIAIQIISIISIIIIINHTAGGGS